MICLQDHGSPASFRNLKIKELPRKAGREVELFNGKDLTGWEAYGTEKWYVDKDGNMVCESGPDKEYGYLATREYYNDFDLTLEFKQLANGNSGVFFRSFVEPPVKVHGWQCEVAPKGFDTAGIYESYGRGWLVQIPDEKEDILREGEWNTLRLKVQGDRVQTWLNGEALVVNIGEMHAGQRYNIIANHAELFGTTRTYNAEFRMKIEEGLRRIAENTAKAFGATATVEYDYYANSLYNDDEELNKIAHDAAVKLYGEACLKELPQMMGSEDFAFFADKIPAVFGFLGTRNEELGMTVGNHNDRYTVHEPVLQRGAALYAQFAADYLERGK